MPNPRSAELLSLKFQNKLSLRRLFPYNLKFPALITPALGLSLALILFRKAEPSPGPEQSPWGGLTFPFPPQINPHPPDC